MKRLRDMYTYIILDKRKRANLAGMLVLLLLLTACGQETSEHDSQGNHSPSLSVVADGATLAKVTAGYNFDTAGSPLYHNGNLYFTNNSFDPPERSLTLKMNSAGKVDTLAIDNGVVTTLQASGKGTMYACEMLGHRVVELNPDGEIIRVVADEYNGQRIDGPNDIVVDNKGGVYFSDSQFIAGRKKMQETPAVYYVNTQGEVLRVIDDIEFPNGLGLSPNGSTLYVANTNGTELLAYNVNSDGTVDSRRDFAPIQLAEGSEISGADGMAVDSEGNVYVATTQGLGVQVFNSQGEHLGNITVDSPVNNVSFGGEDNKTLYISAQNGIYSIPVTVAGFSHI